MKNNWMNWIFITAFICMITIPLLLLDTSADALSEQENRMLTGWPGIHFDSVHNEQYGHYFEDRIGFREQAVAAYSKLLYGIFGEFAGDLHMMGKEGYIFPADEGYIGAYQRLRTDEELIGDLTTYLKRSKEYLDQKGIPFVFMAGLDKKTVYPEYMPPDIHVQTDNKSIMESLAEHLEGEGIAYVIPVEEYMQAKQTQQIYCQKYNCAHWNDLGRIIAVRLADEKLAQQGLDVPVIDESDYDLFYELIEYLEFQDIQIDEQVPYFRLRERPKLKGKKDLTENAWVMPGTALVYSRNPNAVTDKRILIFHDSFMQGAREFYCARYKQVFFVGRQNYECLQYYVNLIRPDAVIFENAERAFVDDLYAYTNLANVRYEPPYESMTGLAEGQASFGLAITGAENARYELKGAADAGSENRTSDASPDDSKQAGTAEERKADKEETSEVPLADVAVDSGSGYFVLQGGISLPQELEKDGEALHLYAKYQNRTYEINYPALREGQPGIPAWQQPASDEARTDETADGNEQDRARGEVPQDNMLPFYMNIRVESKKKIAGEMQILLVDEKTQTEYVAGTLHMTAENEVGE